jgi:drug/metabolite transporter (DMT)-like permease
MALGAALVTVMLWASAFVAIRSASSQLSPEALALGRLAIASVALGLIVAIRRERLPPLRDLPAIAFCGVFWMGIYNIALNEAERRVDAGTAAMLVNLGPILIAVLAGIVLREGFPRQLLAGGSATSRHGLAPSWGALLCVAAAFCYAR